MPEIIKEKTILEQPSPTPGDQEGGKMRATVDQTRPCRVYLYRLPEVGIRAERTVY